MPLVSSSRRLLGLATPGWVLPAARIDMDFARNRYFGLSLEQLVTSRASQGFAEYSVDNNTLLGTFAAGVPRITDRGLLVELAATNLALRSRDFANAAWVATNVTVAQTSNGADATTNGAARLTAGAINSTILQTITGASTARVLSFYIKRITGSGAVGLCQDGVTFTDISAQLNSTGFVQVSLAATQLNPVIGIRLSTSGDAIDVDFAQLETTAAASSPVITTSATATRNADVITYPYFDYSGPITIYAEVDLQQATIAVNQSMSSLSDGSTNNRVVFTRNSGSVALSANVSAGGSATNPGNVATIFTAGRHKLAGSVGVGTGLAFLALDGTLGTTASPAANGIMTTINFGSSAVQAAQLQSYLRRLTVWKTNLSSEQIRLLTQ